MDGVQKVTVLGTGVLGSQIIMQGAYHGKDVTAYDVDDAALARLPERWEWLRTQYRRDLEDFTEERFEDALRRISTTTDLARSVAEADLVIEAVPENLELKRQVWQEVGRSAPEHTLFATNTSTLRPSDFAEATGRPERFGTLHYANFIWRGNIAEVMGTPATAPETMDALLRYAEETGMVGVRIHKEIPAYILNSLLTPFVEAAQELYTNGVASYVDIDRVWTIATGSPRGPFMSEDVMGFNVSHHINTNRAAAAGEGPRPITRLLEKALAEGHAGVSTGEGFYRWDAEGNVLGPGTVMPLVYDPDEQGTASS